MAELQELALRHRDLEQQLASTRVLQQQREREARVTRLVQSEISDERKPSSAYLSIGKM
jgi:hypothetical protein